MEIKNTYKYFENTECEYYPCHNIAEHINCMFCYCPLYSLEKCLGNPQYVYNDGKRIKDCSKCLFPHKVENYELIIRRLCE